MSNDRNYLTATRDELLSFIRQNDLIAEQELRRRDGRSPARTTPTITFTRNQSPVRPWTCNIVLPDDEYHGGEGTTQCEALIMASINWAMHGSVK